MRLQKYLAMCGIASRRKSEALILQGRVKVNGKVIDELGYKIDPDTDIVLFDNKRVIKKENYIYIALNKPEGYITTVKDQFNRPTVLDLVKNINERIYPVGRLDYDTSGLIFLTNDGDLTYRLTHPKHEVEKVYIAKIKGIPTEEELNKFRNGLKIDDYITSKAKIEVLKKYNNYSIVKITIHEGKNRQVRKMCEKINHPVISLKRVAIGKINLGNLKKGNWRYLSKKEIEYLKSL
ncbi:23S rRNA pseudouridine2605 synthase [Caloranaerobacter azorensis DSM 13643]|uniref:Pseudouridine synthase n=1 Tax=Caloranaerobacter azorensis DSM 13643 TaxID=1121264 RepID=A0A1M5TBH8_9FIRM|nr:pseudouridine synthase [Caloranaerobacter azorensis]SHH47960.1 23S rRNA pseudouridine2605 synthase [Caloranaerobacter azorensis DSM 13643]